MLLHKVGMYSSTSGWQAAQESILFHVRLPRVLGAVLVGAALSTAGVLFQGLFSYAITVILPVRENKIVKSAQVMDAIKVMSLLPPGQANIAAAIQYVLENLQSIPEAKSWFPPFPSMPGIPGGMPMIPGMMPPPPIEGNPQQPAPQPGPPGGVPGPTPPNHAPNPNMQVTPPGMKSGPNGNRPAFLPRNPIRRQPIAS